MVTVLALGSIITVKSTVDREIFAVKIFSN